MNKKMFLTSGYISSGLATLIGVSTAILAESPNSMSRASIVAIIFGLFGISSFFFGLVSKE